MGILFYICALMKEIIQQLSEIKDLKISVILLCALIVLTRFSWNHYQEILKMQREKEEHEKKELRDLVERMHTVLTENSVVKNELIRSMDDLKATIVELKRDLTK